MSAPKDPQARAERYRRTVQEHTLRQESLQRLPELLQQNQQVRARWEKVDRVSDELGVPALIIEILIKNQTDKALCERLFQVLNAIRDAQGVLKRIAGEGLTLEGVDEAGQIALLSLASRIPPEED